MVLKILFLSRSLALWLRVTSSFGKGTSHSCRMYTLYIYIYIQLYFSLSLYLYIHPFIYLSTSGFSRRRSMVFMRGRTSSVLVITSSIFSCLSSSHKLPKSSDGPDIRPCLIASIQPDIRNSYILSIWPDIGYPGGIWSCP